ncbi:unknown protein [Arabidopsis thaliana]|nr:unknown protein [Arabidopsis thaliana]
MATKAASSSSLPKSGAISKGYNFASTWEQSAPLTEQQQAAIVSLSHAVAERPFPANLVHEHVHRPENGLSVSVEDTHLGDSGAIEAVLVNTNQFYKWFTDLESAMKSETEEKYRHYVSTLTERIQTCDNILHQAGFQQVDETLDLFNELQLQHQGVTTKTKTLHDACDRLLMEKQKLMEFAEALRSKLNYFDELENSRALGMIRTYILAVLKTAASQAAFRGTGGNKTSVSEGVEASVIYVRFKAAANELKPVLEEIESRSARKEYVQILAECHRLYCEQRLSLVKGIVHQRVSDFAKKEALPSLTRSGCAYLMQTMAGLSALATEDNGFGFAEHEISAPHLVHILKVEVLGDQSARQSEPLAGLRPTLQRILADVNERLTFRARTYIRDEIANYTPSDEDLDYPAKLEGSPNTTSETDLRDDENADVFKTWYPPLEKTLSCLSKLYRCLEQAVFTGLAQARLSEAVEVCSLSIQKASKLIIKRSTTMDGQLFLIKHLLILREQIAPFDIEFSVTHKELDFSHLLEHLRRILRGQASLFDWSRSTSLARTLSPRVLESQIDAKKELEKCLKTTCEEFIMSVTKLVVDPMLSFVTKVTAIKVALSSGTQNHKVDSVMAKPLKEQAFATPDKVVELVQKVYLRNRDGSYFLFPMQLPLQKHDIENSVHRQFVYAAIQQELLPILAKMKLYLQNPSTRTILFKPIKTNIVEAHTQVESLLKAEYSAEEQANINMISIQDLQTQLDNFL